MIQKLRARLSAVWRGLWLRRHDRIDALTIEERMTAVEIRLTAEEAATARAARRINILEAHTDVVIAGIRHGRAGKPRV